MVKAGDSTGAGVVHEEDVDTIELQLSAEEMRALLRAAAAAVGPDVVELPSEAEPELSRPAAARSEPSAARTELSAESDSPTAVAPMPVLRAAACAPRTSDMPAPPVTTAASIAPPTPSASDSLTALAPMPVLRAAACAPPTSDMPAPPVTTAASIAPPTPSPNETLLPVVHIAPAQAVPMVVHAAPTPPAVRPSRPPERRLRVSHIVLAVTAFLGGLITSVTYVAMTRESSPPPVVEAPPPVVDELPPLAPEPAPAVEAPAPEPVLFRNPFDRSEVFEFPAGTTQAEARDAVAEILMQRARERRSLPSELRRRGGKTAERQTRTAPPRS